MQRDDYYVYVAYADEDVVYVGSGRGSRLNHVNSGKSHSKLLNKHVLTVGELSVVKFRENLSNRESLELEQSVLDGLVPKYNVQKKVAYRREQQSELPRWEEASISYGVSGWDECLKKLEEDPCNLFTEGDAESTANYQMREVDEDKTRIQDAYDNRWTSLLPPRKLFEWEL